MRFKGLIVLSAVLLLFCMGCSDKDIAPAAESEILEATETLTPAPEPTEEPTPRETTEPDAAPTVEATDAPTPTPEESGKVVLAEGFYYIELNDEIKERITGISYPEGR